jgi:RNA-directed DNA polymerase
MTEILVDAPLIESLRDLEYRLGTKRAEIAELLKERPLLYRPFQARKKQHPYPGAKRLAESSSKPPKLRQIDNPVKQLKVIQQRINERVLSKVALPGYMFGAVAGKTTALNAAEHIPNERSTLVCMDISSFYPSVTSQHIYRVWNTTLRCPPKIARLLTELTTFEFHLPQGAPTSPMLANIFLASIFAPVCAGCAELRLVVSTWIDDITFSGNAARDLIETVRATLAANGLKAAARKLKILGPSDQKLVTGVRVGRARTRAPHAVASDVRAAIHRLAIGGVHPDDEEPYRANLRGRLGYLGSLDAKDAANIRNYARALRVRLD